MPSKAYLESLIATADDDVALVFLTISDPNLPDWTSLSGGDDPAPQGWQPGHMHFVNNEENILRRGIEYLAWGFDFTPPHQDGTSRNASFRMDNIDPRIFSAVKLLPSDTRLNCEVDVSMASNPDVIDNSYSGFFVTAANADFSDLQFTVSGSHGGNQPANSVYYRPYTSPGLFS